MVRKATPTADALLSLSPTLCASSASNKEQERAPGTHAGVSYCTCALLPRV
jgi:hypothetical protein